MIQQVDEGLQNSVVAQAETVKKRAPYLIQTLRDSIQRPGNCQLRDCKDFFFNSARKSVESLIHMFEKVTKIILYIKLLKMSLTCASLFEDFHVTW